MALSGQQVSFKKTGFKPQEEEYSNTQNKSKKTAPKEPVSDEKETRELPKDSPAEENITMERGIDGEEVTKNSQERTSSFLKKKVSKEGNSAVKMNLYLPKVYLKMNELAAKVYDFSNKSDFVRKLLVNIIDNEELPDLKELYQMALEKTSKPIKPSTKSKYKILESFLPEEKVDMDIECYMVYERHKKILEEFAEQHNTTASKIISNMYDAMTK